jgi:hypothetical protein
MLVPERYQDQISARVVLIATAALSRALPVVSVGGAGANNLAMEQRDGLYTIVACR